MIPTLRHYWEAFRTSLWFLPAVMTVLAAMLGIFSVWLDEVIQAKWDDAPGWFYSGSAEGARHLLATVAGSMVTVAGVVFSVTVVALSLASSQFGPRLLRNFMRDTGNQVVLGTFIATFVYCLLVLRTVRGQDGGTFVPHVSVTIAVLMALASLGVLIYFIHHAAVSMQAPHIIANVSEELGASINALFPEKLGDETDENETAQEQGDFPEGFKDDSQSVPAKDEGYVQLIQNDRLMVLAVEKDVLLTVVLRPGHFVIPGDPLVQVWPARAADEELEARVRRSFVLGPQQTPTQDVEFAVNQLVEIAVRALSPGINDPFTAIACLDRLGAALCRLAERQIPSPNRRDEQGRVRVIAYPVSFANVTDAAFRQIRQYGRASTAVLVRMLEVIEAVIPHVRHEADLAALSRHALLVEQCATDLPQQADRDDVEDRYQEVLKAVADARGKRRTKPE